MEFLICFSARNSFYQNEFEFSCLKIHDEMEFSFNFLCIVLLKNKLGTRRFLAFYETFSRCYNRIVVFPQKISIIRLELLRTTVLILFCS